MPNITHYLVINAPAETVYKAVTEEAGLASWWAKNTIAKPEVGFTDEFIFGDSSKNYKGEGRHHNKMLVTELVPNTLARWDCKGGDPEWIGTRLSFEMTPGEGKTELMFTHADWAAQTQFFANCNYFWGMFMTSLKQYCETGTGTPY